jgi:hypothetical protein
VAEEGKEKKKKKNDRTEFLCLLLMRLLKLFEVVLYDNREAARNFVNPSAHVLI